MFWAHNKLYPHTVLSKGINMAPPPILRGHNMTFNPSSAVAQYRRQYCNTLDYCVILELLLLQNRVSFESIDREVWLNTSRLTIAPHGDLTPGILVLTSEVHDRVRSARVGSNDRHKENICGY
ncbi:hypothetical protein XELAEV_18042910mg [Xenopus laevis]|uniref:Uncharacterized protein n=1 Tax=Xenopus laevis TaxID=8355 RepID=A0A974C532_XENLA|nr:hypothetical protein XELAEV_18042910mg [Xenopus laevis]